MFFEERIIFVVCIIALVFFAIFLFFDNASLMLKNGKLRKENKKLKSKVSVYEKQKAKEQERLRPYFDDAKGYTVNPQAEAKKHKGSLIAIASAMSMLSQNNIKK